MEPHTAVAERRIWAFEKGGARGWVWRKLKPTYKKQRIAWECGGESYAEYIHHITGRQRRRGDLSMMWTWASTTSTSDSQPGNDTAPAIRRGGDCGKKGWGWIPGESPLGLERGVGEPAPPWEGGARHVLREMPSGNDSSIAPLCASHTKGGREPLSRVHHHSPGCRILVPPSKSKIINEL